jgi:hypothetical protein
MCQFDQEMGIQLNSEYATSPALQLLYRLDDKLRLKYMVRYTALDRRLRKIVKNKYRYHKYYARIPPHRQRNFALRLLVLAVSFRVDVTLAAWLAQLLRDFTTEAPDSLLLGLMVQHQNVTLATLAAR